MAKDVITRFKLETTQYDSKLRDAAKELTNFAKTATQAGKEFNNFTKSNVEAARALGQTASGATNVKDRLKDTVAAFNSVAKAYNSLTDAQKQSDFGKAMSASLKQLQQRIRETKQEMQGLENASGKMSGSAGGLFGGNFAGMKQVLGGNLMTKGVMMAADAVSSLASETYDMVKQGIELAKQGEGIRIAFERLGRGDILDGLREATHGTVTDLELMKAAVKFNDFNLPVSELGTMLAFAQQKAKDTGQSVDYMVDSIVTGLGRKSLMILDNLGLSAAEIKQRMKETGDMTTAVGAIIRDQMAKAGDYVETAADRAAQANVSLQNKMEELGRKFAPLEEASNQLWTSMKIAILDVVGGPLTQLINGLTEAGRLRNELNKHSGEGGEVDTQLRFLREWKGDKQYRYNKQLSAYAAEEEKAWRRANTYRNAYNNEMANNPGSQAAASYWKAWQDSMAQARAWKTYSQEYQKGAKDILNPQAPSTPTASLETPKTPKIPKSSGHTQLTPAQQAEKDVERANKDYADTISNAQQKLIEHMIKSDDYDKQVLSGQERLAEAYLKAYNTTGNEKYLNSFRELAAQSVDLKDTINANAEAQKAAEQAAREQAAAEKKLAEEIKKRAELEASFRENTEGGVGAFISNQKGVLQKAEYGSQDYRQLSANIADANTYKNLMATAIQDGLYDIVETMKPLWEQIVGEKNIGDTTWQSYVDEINAVRKSSGKEAISLDYASGDVKAEEHDDKLMDKVQKVTSGLQQVSGGLQQMGIKLPDGVTKVLGGVQGLMSVIQGVQAVISVFSTSTATAQVTAITANTGMLTAVNAQLPALLYALTANAIKPYAGGGIVGRAASGLLVGNSYSGDNRRLPVVGGGMIGVNDGELILNRAQQGVLADALTGGSGDAGRAAPPYVTGQTIVLGMNNYLRASGQGEIVTTKMLRNMRFANG